ncbi:hypothetical protein [Paenibacillus pinistramenti]|uniref:hypothetical protein n=1 Tax=Paenibacillus pinistramenti TaxID=1768003 RepID=UPI0011089026|nr:hypothetical protein [Paenibacillus pinistramenti]
MIFLRRYSWLLLLILIAVVGVIWWSNDFISKRDKIDNALKTSIQQAAEVVQLRVKEREIVKDPKSVTYYAVNMQDTGNQLMMMQEVLYELNNNSSLPPLKLKEYRVLQVSSIGVNATVEYVTLFGIHKEISVHLNVPRIPFKGPSGDETYR